ncbi:MAG: hypothetical protein ABIG09_06185 [bacterium]
MACKRFLLLIDFLGFSDFVLKEPLKHVLAWYEETTKESMSWLDKRNVKQSDNCILKWNYLSDSLFLWIDNYDRQKEAILLLVYYVNQMIYTFPPYNKNIPFAPIRGALVYDSFEVSEKKITGKYRTETQQLVTGKITHTEDYSLSKEIYMILGRAVVNAVKWEKEQNWIGISIAPYCVNDIEENYPNELGMLLNSRLLHKYKVPTKDNIKLTYAFNGIMPSPFSKDILSELEKILASSQGNAIEDKYKNTLDYVRWIKENELHVLPLVEFSL